MLNWEQNKWNYIHHWELPCSDWCPAPHPTSSVKWWEVSNSKNKNQTQETKQISHFVLFKGLKKTPKDMCVQTSPSISAVSAPWHLERLCSLRAELSSVHPLLHAQEKEWTIFLGTENTRSQQWRPYVRENNFILETLQNKLEQVER